MWLVVHLRSILGVRNKVIVLLNWLWNYISYSQSLRMIVYAKKAKEVVEREQRLASTHWGTDLLSEGSEDMRTKTADAPMANANAPQTNAAASPKEKNASTKEATTANK